MTSLAVIFDMDGVISDTQKFHSLAESELLKKYAIHRTPEEITHRYSGVSAGKMFREIFETDGVPMPDIEQMVAEKYDLLFEMAQGKIEPIPGIVALLCSLHEADIATGVASASRPDFISLVLDSLDIRKYFHKITSGREVTHGKPAPDIFLLAASRLGKMPDSCIVIEDANNGVAAAKAAGMKCVGYQGNPPSSQDLSRADLIITSFEELNKKKLEELL